MENKKYTFEEMMGTISTVKSEIKVRFAGDIKAKNCANYGLEMLARKVIKDWNNICFTEL